MRRVGWAAFTLAVGIVVAAEPAGPALDPIKALLKGGQYADAEDRARAALAGAEDRFGRDSLEVARVLDLLVEALWRSGKGTAAEAKALAERAVEIKTSVLGPENVEVAGSLGHLAIVHREAARFTEALLCYERALAILEKALGPEDPKVAAALNNLGLLLKTIGDYAAAETAFARAIAIREKPPATESPELAQNLSNLALVLRQMGRYEEARALYERAIAVKERLLPAGHPEIATTVSNFGSLLRDMGDFVSAKAHYERALAILRGRPGSNPVHVAAYQSNLALVLSDMGDYGTSMDLYQQALATQEAALGERHPSVAATLENLAGAYRSSGDLARARALCERSLQIREASLPPGHQDIAWSLNTLALILGDMGNIDEARPLYERALAIWREALGPDNPTLAEGLVNYGALLEKAGDAPGAKEAYERALTIRENALGSSHPLVGATLQALGACLIKNGDTVRGLETALRADAVGREHLRLTCRSLPERQALRYASVRSSGLDLALPLAAQDVPAVWDALVRSRALVLDEMAARHRAATVVPGSEIERIRRSLVDARTRLANLRVRGPDAANVNGYRKLLEEARVDGEHAEQALAEASAVFRGEQARTRLGYAEIAASLKDGSALVAYGLRRSRDARSEYYALILPSGDATPLVQRLGSAEAMDVLVDAWYREAASPPRTARAADAADTARYREAGERLRRSVWDPVAAHLDHPGQVFIVPDGSLHLVNFSSLPTGRDAFLVETGPGIHYLSTERDLVSAESRATHEARGLLSVGGPAFDATSVFAALRRKSAQSPPGPVIGSARTYRGPTSSCDDFRSLRFAPLSASLREAEDVAALWTPEAGDAGPPATEVDLLTGAKASEALFKDRAPGKRVLHLATHGFFLGGDCAQNPLQLSGLALAGANHRAAAGPGEDDGILTAEEIAALDLSSVQWAVLSACDTGLGELHAGEGVFGLRRSFLVAGAATVIMSLWTVEDAAARRWMSELYDARLREGADTATAVREASLRALNERRQKKRSTHPFYWAGFVAIGEWR